MPLLTGFAEGDPSITPAIIAASEASADFSDPAAEAEIGWVVDLVTAIRSVRAEMNITPATLTPLVLAGCVRGDKGARAAPGRCSQAPRAACRHLVRRPRAGRRGAAIGARRGRGLAAERRDRSCGGEDAARQGTGQGRGRHQARRRKARPTRNSSPTRLRKSSRKKKKSARPPPRERPRSSRRWSGSRTRREYPAGEKSTGSRCRWRDFRSHVG